jgi:hypothetical protein
MIDEICDQANDNAIRRALEDLPRQLSDIFDRKLARIAESTCSQLCLKLLQFCGVTKRPLTLEEFREALGIELGQEYLDSANLPNDIRRIVASCYGLIYADEEEFTVHYVHHSVKQHLFEFPDPRTAHFEWPAVDKHLGLLCMTYLNFKELSGEIAKAGKSIPIDPIAIGRLALDVESDFTSRIARQILKRNKKGSTVGSNDLKTRIQGISGTTGAPSLRLQFRFLPYAKQNWIHHLKRLKPSDGKDNWELFCRCVAGEVHEADCPWLMYSSSSQGISTEMVGLSQIVDPMTLWAILHNHQALLSEDFRRPPQDLEALWPMTHNATKRHGRILKMIDYNPLRPDNDKLASALMMAIDNDFVKLIKVFLNAGADPNTVMTYNLLESPTQLTALQLAAARGSFEVVDLLLDHGAHVNQGAMGNGGRTALQAAAERGNTDVVRRLLRAGAIVGAAPAHKRGVTAVQAAKRNRFLDVEKLLLNPPQPAPEPSRYPVRPPTPFRE